MIIDLTVKVKEDLWKKMLTNHQAAVFGHIGTHFDVMNKEFPLDNHKTCGKIIDVRNIWGQDIDIDAIANNDIKEKDFVIFYTDFLSEKQYGTAEYFNLHPQLSKRLIQHLLDKRVSLIGIDAPGIRRGAEHVEIDQHCANSGVFVVENLANLDLLFKKAGTGAFTVYTFPVNMEGISGLPSRVVAEV